MSLTFRKIVAASLSTNFREACKIVHSEVGNLGDKEVLVKNRLLEFPFCFTFNISF